MSGPTVDVGLFGMDPGVCAVIVFWWAFFTESLSVTASVVTDGE